MIISVSLSNQLQTTRVYLISRRNKAIPLDYQVAIDIARFDGELGRDAMLIARWSLYDMDNKTILTKVSIINEASEGIDFESLVAAENQALQKLSSEIAEAIKSDKF
ncbi:MAG: membrane integrity-associated transporter subunit PqiC [Methylococcales bacterium]|nr:membrane integrity-associated transporter subunit PqiC [Methylococcales bacterium]